MVPIPIEPLPSLCLQATLTPFYNQAALKEYIKVLPEQNFKTNVDTVRISLDTLMTLICIITLRKVTTLINY
jgi:hypothetical protein